MRKRILSITLVCLMLLSLCSCSPKDKDSSFSIQFIDVGQGDSALVQCDKQYMLIDGGGVKAGDDVYTVLENEKVRELDILAVSHLHKDHYGGLIKALTYVSKIGITISNADERDEKNYREFESRLRNNGSQIKIPAPGDKYKLGSATVEVIDSHAVEDNDSLVLLITYGKTRFLFTGDIERTGQLRVIEALQKDKKKNYKKWVSLIKMPHHGAYNDKETLYWLLREYYPNYCVISSGDSKHPNQRTLDMLENLIVRDKELNWNKHVFRTDKDGDIIVKSDGKEISVEKTKN